MSNDMPSTVTMWIITHHIENMLIADPVVKLTREDAITFAEDYQEEEIHAARETIKWMTAKNKRMSNPLDDVEYSYITARGEIVCVTRCEVRLS
ncbi:MAG: hypothetical protein ACRC6G_13670 [Deefgea sp.]